MEIMSEWHTLQTTSCNWIPSGGESRCGKHFQTIVLCIEVLRSILPPLNVGYREWRFQEIEKWSSMVNRGSTRAISPEKVAECWWDYSCGQSIRTRTSKSSKNWKSVTSKWSLTGIPETCCFSTTMPDLTQTSEPRGNHQIWLETTPSYSRDLALSGFHLFGPSKDVLRGHGYVNREQAVIGKEFILSSRAEVRL